MDTHSTLPSVLISRELYPTKIASAQESLIGRDKGCACGECRSATESQGCAVVGQGDRQDAHTTQSGIHTSSAHSRRLRGTFVETLMSCEHVCSRVVGG